MTIFKNRQYEKTLAGISLFAAILIAFVALYLSPAHEVAATTSMVIAQFLTLTATLLGFDYKFNPTNHE